MASMTNFRKIEKKWQAIWEKEKIYEPNLKNPKRPFYNLWMFPYPSAEGLHIGGARTFVGVDIYGRYKRMKSYDVFEPVGLDGFGIHSENYALKIKKHPMLLSKITEKNFYRQLKMIGNGFAWREKLETYDPNYYKWTQWIFIQLFKNGLAYRKKQAVNWCSSCKTVLADEQVIDGKCERCGAEVVKKDLEQWFFRITKYADRLLKNLDKIDWSEKVKTAQRNWIGQSRGTEIKFRIQNSELRINVFTTRLDTIYGCTYLVVAPERVSALIQNSKFPPEARLAAGGKIQNYREVQKYIEQAKKKSDLQRTMEMKDSPSPKASAEQGKTGVELKGVKAINPFNNEVIPIFVADYILGHYGTGAVMAVPSHDERDLEFATRYHLPIKEVITSRINAEKHADKRGNHMVRAFIDDGILINSGKYSGLTSEKAREEMTKWLEKNKLGGKKINYKLRDWLISRQRYWGPPIPLIFCKNCKKEVEAMLKTKKFPRMSALSQRMSAFAAGEIESPGWIVIPEKDLPVKLPYIKDFRPTGKGQSPLASHKEFYEVKCPKCGNEARRETDVSDTFLDSVWYYLGYLMKFGNWKLGFGNSLFSNLVRRWCPVHSYIGGAEHAVLHLLYSRFIAMALKDLKLLHFEEPFAKFRAHGLITRGGAKMSKSRGNVVNPDKYFKTFGADAMRMHLAFMAPLYQDGDFREEGISGLTRFLNRVRKFSRRVRFSSKNNVALEWLFNKTIKKVGEDIENLRFNTAISSLMILFNQIEPQPDKISGPQFEIFIKLLAPFAPFMTEEIWRTILGKKQSIHISPWPEYNSRLIKEKTFELVIQINGKVRDKISAPQGISQKEAETMAQKSEKIKKIIGGHKIRKIIFVPGRLINFVIQ